jgi:hypothetical protein
MSKLTILLVAFAAVATALPTHGKNVHKAPHPKKTHGRRVSAQTYHEDDDVLVQASPGPSSDDLKKQLSDLNTAKEATEKACKDCQDAETTLIAAVTKAEVAATYAANNATELATKSSALTTAEQAVTDKKKEYTDAREKWLTFFNTLTFESTAEDFQTNVVNAEALGPIAEALVPLRKAVTDATDAKSTAQTNADAADLAAKTEADKIAPLVTSKDDACSKTPQ